MGQVKDEKLLKEIAIKIKALRESKGITQEAFYHDTNIHIGRIETGKNNLSVSSLKAICKYFGITLKEFFSKMDF